MEMVAKVVTEFFMMVLCVTSAPVDQQEIRIDVVGDRGYVDTIIVRRQDVGFTVHDEMNGKLVKIATIRPRDGAKNVFVCTSVKGKSETINLVQAIPGMKLSELRNKSRLRLKTADGGAIAIDRSKDVVFMTPSGSKHTYVVH